MNQQQNVTGHEKTREAAIRDLTIPGHEALVETLIADPSVSVSAAASRIVQAVKAEGTPMGRGTLFASVEDRCKATWASDPQVRAEFRSLESFTAYTRANEKGLTR
ncbi:MAG TPA: hypothetical protein PJ986_10575 [Gammaproteobacteria bacterium]|nr:hypothetical protein [Gammaproteobacteria bacterium]